MGDAKKPAAAWGLPRPTARILLFAMVVVPLSAVFLGRAFMSSLPRFTLPSPPRAVPQEPGPAEDRTPEIRGRVLDANGDAVEGAVVRLVSPTPPYAVLRDAKSDAAGRFSFARVRDERVRLVADRDPDAVASSAELHAQEGKTIEITLVLSLANTVRGAVVDAQDRPVEGARVSVEGAPWTVPSMTTDGAGSFQLTKVPEEATSLVAVARGYKTARVALVHRADQAELVVRVHLAAAPSVEGDVSDADGKPVRARVVACDGQPSEARAVSADDGTFVLPPSAIGCAAIAQHDEYAPSDAVTVVEGSRLVLRLKPGGSVEGVVVDDRGTTVPSFRIGIESFSAPRARNVRGGIRRNFEDPRGLFRWDNLAPGTYVFTAAAPGMAPTRSDSIEVAGGATTRGVRIVLSRGGSVIGHVYDDRHAPLRGVDLRFDAVSSALDSSVNAKTDDTGQYRLDGAPAGPFTLRVQKDGFRLHLLSGLRVDAHGTLTQDVTLTSFDGGEGLEFGGIGANLAQTRDGISLGAVFTGDPAERAGLRAGDRVVRVDGEETAGMSVADVLQRLRGEAGTTVGVSVLRPGTGETLDVIIVRAAIVR
jgi:hypothetical protein